MKMNLGAIATLLTAAHAQKLVSGPLHGSSRSIPDSGLERRSSSLTGVAGRAELALVRREAPTNQTFPFEAFAVIAAPPHSFISLLNALNGTESAGVSDILHRAFPSYATAGATRTSLDAESLVRLGAEVDPAQIFAAFNGPNGATTSYDDGRGGATVIRELPPDKAKAVIAVMVIHARFLESLDDFGIKRSLVQGSVPALLSEGPVNEAGELVTVVRDTAADTAAAVVIDTNLDPEALTLTLVSRLAEAYFAKEFVEIVREPTTGTVEYGADRPLHSLANVTAAIATGQFDSTDRSKLLDYLFFLHLVQGSNQRTLPYPPTTKPLDDSSFKTGFKSLVRAQWGGIDVNVTAAALSRVSQSAGSADKATYYENLARLPFMTLRPDGSDGPMLYPPFSAHSDGNDGSDTGSNFLPILFGTAAGVLLAAALLFFACSRGRGRGRTRRTNIPLSNLQAPPPYVPGGAPGTSSATGFSINPAPAAPIPPAADMPPAYTPRRAATGITALPGQTPTGQPTQIQLPASVHLPAQGPSAAG